MLITGKSTHYDVSTTSNATKHLKKYHKVFQNGNKTPELPKQLSLETAFPQTKDPFDAMLFKTLIVQWIVFTNQPFVQTSNKYYRWII